MSRRYQNHSRRVRLNGPLIMLAVLFGLFVLADAALLLFAPRPNPLSRIESKFPFVNQYVRMEYPRDFVVHWTVEEGLPGVKGPDTFSTNNMGLRGQTMQMPKPSNEYRIVMIGGSTTECFFLGDNDAINFVLERALSNCDTSELVPRVYGAGFSGAASDDHVALLGQRVVHMDPDMVIVFAGINDLTRSIYDFDYLHFIDRVPTLKVPLYKRLALNSQIMRRIYYLRRQITPAARQIQEEFSEHSNYADKVTLRKSVPINESAVPRIDPLPYERNLRSIVGTAHANNIALVLMTQPSSWNSSIDSRASNYHWMTLRNNVRYSEAALDTALESLNDVMRAVATSENVPLHDLGAVIPKSLDYFYDDCHFNINGARVAGEGLADFLCENGLTTRQP